MQPSVTVVITVHDHPDHLEHLAETLASVAHQTTPAAEVIVVASDRATVAVAGSPHVRLVECEHGGRAAARNAGLKEARSGYVQFLEPQDVLTPVAIAAGLACAQRHPGASLVSGAHRIIDGGDSPLGPRRVWVAGDDPVASLLRGDVPPHAAVLYRRDALEEAGGFDEELSGAEDYDVLLRVARLHPVASQPTETVRSRATVPRTSEERARLRAALKVHHRHRPAATDPERLVAWQTGRRRLRTSRAEQFLDVAGASGRRRSAAILGAARLSPRLVGGVVVGEAMRYTVTRLPAPLRDVVARRHPGAGSPSVGRVRLGDLDRTEPVSRDFGFDRGLPVDRYYIENFLEASRGDIFGRVLEVGDAAYSQRFGGSRIERQDVVHVHAGNPDATIIGDISRPGTLPRAAFDCVVLTQTLHLIYDMRAAVEELHASLKPDGVLLLTVPGISQIDRGEWGEGWFWSLTPAAVRRLLGEVFGEEAVIVEGHGNVFAATAFLHGLAQAEVDTTKLDARDDAYPVIVTARAQKLPLAPASGG